MAPRSEQDFKKQNPDRPSKSVQSGDSHTKWTVWEICLLSWQDDQKPVCQQLPDTCRPLSPLPPRETLKQGRRKGEKKQVKRLIPVHTKILMEWAKGNKFIV